MKPSKNQFAYAEKLILIFFAIIIYGEGTTIRYTYKAAVVEYQKIQNFSMTYMEKVNYTVRDYIKLIEGISEDVDVIVFPEATLTNLVVPIDPLVVTEVPRPYSENLCNSSKLEYLDFIKKLSCTAMKKRTTLVINLIEKENCTSNDISGFCPTTGLVFYNSDVVLNEEGSVSARYRKFNLFHEPGLSPPLEVEIVNFTTKNNDSFGIFTCFDILFQKPALMLPRYGIRNILYPTMWFSELPYLTALQVQQMWAQENNVTVLSSGANNPRVGSGGTGLYIGSKGPLNQTIIGDKGGTEILIAEVPNIAIKDNPYINKIIPLVEDNDSQAEHLDDFKLMKDPSILQGHTSVVLNTNTAEIDEEICNGLDQKICCRFHIRMKFEKNVPRDKNVYTYHLAAFSGTRSFVGVRMGGIETCAVLACLNTSISSCGERFPKYTDIVWPLTFEEINVSAAFERSDSKIQFPSSLLVSLRPISPQYTLWNKIESGEMVRRNHILKKPHAKILTFGIFGRDFSRDSPYPSKSIVHKTNNLTTILLVILSVVLVIFNKL